MQEISEQRFKFAIGSLPAQTFVKLSDALDLALYGGVRSVNYAGHIRLPSEEEREFAITTAGEWVLITDEGPVLGPQLIDVANPGAILFGIDDNWEPDPTQVTDQEDKYLRRTERHRLMLANLAKRAKSDLEQHMDAIPASVPRRYGSDAIKPRWRAEMDRRCDQFFARLNIAARSGQVRFMGTPVDAQWLLEPSSFGSKPEEILAAYFIEDRVFDEDNHIHAGGECASDPDFVDDAARGRKTSDLAPGDVLVLNWNPSTGDGRCERAGSAKNRSSAF